MTNRNNETGFLGSNLFSLSPSPEPFAKEFPNITKTYENKFVRPLKPMPGIGESNENIINSQLTIPSWEQTSLIEFINESNKAGNERVAGDINTSSCIASMAGCVAGLDFVCSRLSEQPVIIRGFIDLLGAVYYGPLVSKVVEVPARIAIDAIRMGKQEENTRRFLNSEGIS